MLLLTFSNLLGSNNPSIPWSLKLLLPKASASTFYCFQICQRTARQFKILVSLYLYRLIIIFNLALHQVLLVIELNEVRNFCQQISDFCITFVFENITKILYEERAFDHLYLLLAYISLREILQIELLCIVIQAFFKHSVTMFWRYLRLIWKMFVKKQ